jgi:hypothetical protein
MDPELIAYLDARFRETSQQIAGLREETTQQISSLREETTQQIRQVYVVIEGLRHEIQLVAEGVAGNNERLDAFRTEVAQEFKDVRSLIDASYKDLDRRIRPLEKKSA